MSWIFFAIAAPALFGASNLIDKFLVEKKFKNLLFVVILTGLASLVLAIIIFLFIGFHTIETKQLFLILISGILLELYLLPYFKALTIDDVSRVVPLFQFVPIFVLVLSYVLLGEALTGKQFSGSILIIIGSFTLTTEKFEKGIFKLRKSLGFMLLASLLYAITGILFKMVVIAEDFWLTLAYESVGMAIGGCILLLWPAYRVGFQQEIRRLNLSVWYLLFVNQVLYVSALFSTFRAFLLAPVALVSVISGVQPFFVLVYGLVLSVWFPRIIKEDLDKKTILIKVLAIALIFMGGYLVYV